MNSETLEKWGSALGILGALLLATGGKITIVGFILFIISSILFIKFARINGYKNIVKQHCIFLAIDAWGIFNWILTYWK